MMTESDTKIAMRQSRKTTQVRVKPSDVKVLDDIAYTLRISNPEVRYTRSDAVSWLIGFAQFHGHLPLSTPKDLYTGAE